MEEKALPRTMQQPAISNFCHEDELNEMMLWCEQQYKGETM
jgi:hypothetical protein